MRVAYVVGWPGGPASGPFKKIAAQTRVWADEGVDVGLFVITQDEHVDAWERLPGAVQVQSRRKGLQLAWQKERLLKQVTGWQADVIYHRWTLAYPGLVRAARRMPVVVEVNSDDVAEYDLLQPLKGRVNRATRGLVLSHVAGLAFVTHELSQAASFAGFDRPHVVIANGITLSDVPNPPAPANERPRLLFIGARGCPWHGTDKVVQLARQQPGWDFDLVGPAASDMGNVPPNVTPHGMLDAVTYARLVAAADVGIGSLALHRNSLNEASPLKVREYLAAGLPVIAGYVDSDFPDGADFLLTLPNDEHNVRDAVEQIARFVSRWRGRRVPRDQVRHLDHVDKERARLAFLESVRRRPISTIEGRRGR